MCKFVAYYRTSTSKQSLSFDAQKAAVNAYIRDGELIAEFTEVETGKNNDRPKLKEAIALAKKTKLILIIAKLDRLSRILLGNRTNWKEAQALGHEMNIKLAAEHADKILPIIRDLARKDAGSLHRIADELNARNIPTRRNATWTGTLVRNIIRRAGFTTLRELA